MNRRAARGRDLVGARRSERRSVRPAHRRGRGPVRRPPVAGHPVLCHPGQVALRRRMYRTAQSGHERDQGDPGPEPPEVGDHRGAHPLRLVVRARPLPRPRPAGHRRRRPRPVRDDHGRGDPHLRDHRLALPGPRPEAARRPEQGPHRHARRELRGPRRPRPPGPPRPEPGPRRDADRRPRRDRHRQHARRDPDPHPAPGRLRPGAPLAGLHPRRARRSQPARAALHPACRRGHGDPGPPAGPRREPHRQPAARVPPARRAGRLGRRAARHRGRDRRAPPSWASPSRTSTGGSGSARPCTRWPSSSPAARTCATSSTRSPATPATSWARSGRSSACPTRATWPARAVARSRPCRPP